jgi:hypothetical protein
MWRYLAGLVILALGLVSCNSSVNVPPEDSSTASFTTQAVSTSVIPIAWSSFTAAAPSDVNAVRSRTILQNTNKYALTTWWNSVKNFAGQTGTYLDFGGRTESNIRPPAAEAVALATALKTGAYNASATGVDVATAKSRTVKLVSSLAYRHQINTSGGWGNEWQSTLWAYYAGLAGWMMWDDLTTTDREYVRKMVEYEAARMVGYQVPYYKDRVGTIQYPGDSKAEENAWNAMLLQLAVRMMNDHPQAISWYYKNLELKISAFSRPSDVTSNIRIHERPLSDWLNGSNINQDGVIINHNLLHPDYMATVVQNAQAAIVAGLVRKSTPKAATFNADVVYDALVDLNFTAGSAYPPGPNLAAPGGNIFRTSSSNIYYPQGNDWGTSRRMHFAQLDVAANILGFDTLTSKNGVYWEPYHAQKVLDMQNRHSDGKTYASSSEDTYSGREEWVAEAAATAYFFRWLKAQNAISFADQLFALVVDNRDRGFSVVAGDWPTSVASVAAGNMGLDTRYNASGSGGDKARFTPQISTAGNYRVSVWWASHTNRATNTPFTIVYNGGSQTIRVNQQTQGGQWYTLGTFNFAIGTGGYVQVSDDTDGYVIADAVKWEPVP